MNLKQIDMYVASVSLVTIVMFCFLAGISITISPFRIEFNNMLNAIAWVMIVGGFMLGVYDASKKANKEGYEEALKDVKEMLETNFDEEK